MGKSFLERLARGLGKSTGKLVEKAKERGLDKKAGELVEKAQERLKGLVKEYEEGQSEARSAREADSEDGDERAAEEKPDGESAEDGPRRGEDRELDGAREPDEARRDEGATEEPGDARGS